MIISRCKKTLVCIGGCVVFIMPLSAHAFTPVEILTRPDGVPTPYVKFQIDPTKLPLNCINPDLTATVTAKKVERNAIRFAEVRFYDASGPVGANVASKESALSNDPYAFTFKNFRIPLEKIRTLQGIQLSFIDQGGDTRTADRVQITNVSVSVDCSVGASCVSTDLSLAAAKPPATLASIQGARPIVGYGGGCSGGSLTSSGPNSPGTMANDASFGDYEWVNVDNAKVSDNVYSTTSHIGLATFNYLKATNFSFSIPAGSTINGITVEVEKRKNDIGAVTDSRVRIVKNGTIGSTDKSNGSEWSATDAYITYGSSSDLWGETWTVSDINSSTFGFVIAPLLSGPVDGYIDHIRITISYTSSTTCASIYDAFSDLITRFLKWLSY